MIVSTQLIVLAKHPYRESAWIASGLSPDYGRFSVVVHGGQAGSKEHPPAVDLFRELEVEFRESEKSPLQTADRVEVLHAFDAIAEKPLCYKLAGRIGAFLMANSEENAPLPFTYDSFKSILKELSGDGDAPESGGWTPEQCSVVIKTVFLYENGLLPQAETEARNNFLENLVAAGIDNSPLPECRPDYWSSFNAWLNSLIAFHGMKK